MKALSCNMKNKLYWEEKYVNLNQKRRLMIIGALLILLGVSFLSAWTKHVINCTCCHSYSIISRTNSLKNKFDFTSFFITFGHHINVPYTVIGHLWMVALGGLFWPVFHKNYYSVAKTKLFNAEALGIIFLLLSFPAYFLNQQTGNATGEMFVYTALGLALLLMVFKGYFTLYVT